MDEDQRYMLPGEQTATEFDSKTLANMRMLEANELFPPEKRQDGKTAYRLPDLVDRGNASTSWSRSATFFDMDSDGVGLMDLVMNNLLEPAVVYRNRSDTKGSHWLMVRLEGDPSAGSTRDAIGARLIVETSSGNRIWREVRSAGGYLSNNPKEQHFGLGRDSVARLSIRWPSGKESEVKDLAVNTRYVIAERDNAVRQVVAGKAAWFR